MAIPTANALTGRSIVELSAMLKTAEGPKLGKPGTASAAAPAEATYDTLKAAAARLMAELAIIKRELLADREETLKTRDRFRDFLRTQRRLLENHVLFESHPGKTLPAIQCGDLAEAEAVLAAKQRVASRKIG